jgi:DNA modification methylase
MPKIHVEKLAEGITLYLGDCRKVLPKLQGIDMICTDPPYQLTAAPQTHCSEIWRGKYPEDGIFFPQVPWKEWLPMAFKSLKPSKTIYLMANDKNISTAIEEMKLVGFRQHNLLVWRKPNGTPNRWYFKECEFIAYGWKPGKAPRTINRPSSPQIFHSKRELDSGHRTQKPVELMMHYINNDTSKNDMVLDPFLGSGTTGVAAAKLRRCFIGIEIEPKYFDMSCRRISQALTEPEFFSDRLRPFKQKSFNETWIPKEES